jgi:hypothetical protein
MSPVSQSNWSANLLNQSVFDLDPKIRDAGPSIVGQVAKSSGSQNPGSGLKIKNSIQAQISSDRSSKWNQKSKSQSSRWLRKIITNGSKKFRIWSYEQMYESMSTLKAQNRSSLMKNALMCLIMRCHWRASSRFDSIRTQPLESDRSEILASCSQFKKIRSKSTSRHENWRKNESTKLQKACKS